MPYFEKRIVSGNLVEIEQFFSSGKRLPRGVRCVETSQSQAEQNDRQSEKEFIRLLNCNFDPAKGDIFATLTFSEAVDKAGAAKAFRNFELRVKRYCAKKKAEYKRLSMFEQQGKWHIHMILSTSKTVFARDYTRRGAFSVLLRPHSGFARVIWYPFIAKIKGAVYHTTPRANPLTLP